MNPRRSLKIAALGGLISLVGVAACSKKDSEAEAAAVLGVTTVTQADRNAANEIFTSRCVPCHGASGAGDGPASATLSPKPRKFNDPSWQNTVTTEHITKIIRYGGAGVGKSAAMPANPDLESKGAVVAALTAKVRAFGGK